MVVCSVTLHVGPSATFAVSESAAPTGLIATSVGAQRVTLDPGQSADFFVSLTAGASAAPGERAVVLRASGGTNAMADVTLPIRVLPAGPVVRTVYLVPSDQDPRPGFADSLNVAMHRVQLWYQGALGTGRTFTVAPTVPTVRLPHPAEWYNTHPAGADSTYWFYFNVAADAFAAVRGARWDDPTNAWMFVLDVPSSRNGAAAAGGIFVLDGSNMENLAGLRTSVSQCQATGVVAHELGHIFGLPHPEPGKNSIMYEWWLYPSAGLIASEKATLSGSAFFRAAAGSKPLPCSDLGRTVASPSGQAPALTTPGIRIF